MKKLITALSIMLVTSILVVVGISQSKPIKKKVKQKLFI